MRQCECAKGKTADQFVDAYNALNRKISRIGKVIRETEITPTEVIVYYEIPDEEPKLEPELECHCCDCNNYEWGRKCLAGVKRVRPMTPACEFFNVEIETGTES